MAERGLGKWILPQPKNKEYVTIPRISRTIPFGYKVEHKDDEWLIPIPSELEALEQAKKHLKQYSLREVANWLTTLTGRPISHVGLSKRIKSEQSHKRKSTTYRNIARKYQKALQKAEQYEERIGTKPPEFFESDIWKSINSFDPTRKH